MAGKGGTNPVGRWRNRGAMTSRVLTAIVGGYALASFSAMMLARLLPGDRAAAAVWGTLLSYAVLAGAVVWTYAAPSAWRALWVVLVGIAVTGGISWLSIATGGRL